ncbi:MAG: hypothetical protein LBM27_03880 [Lactobacillaceae bacterium]|jgi:hypothetical protein|nr:hypothetical protein [Lactobacillaceae bacterium]
MKKKYKWLIAVLVVIVVAAVGVQQFLFPNQFGRFQTTSKYKKGEASQEPLYSDKEFLKRMSKYPAFKDGLEQSTAVPGIQGAWSLEIPKKATDLTNLKMIKSKGLDPQGIAVSDKYIFISAYDDDKKVLSVIYVVDKNSGKYVKTIVLPDHAHTGGLAYDPKSKMLWAAGYEDKFAVLLGMSDKTIADYDINSHKAAKFDTGFVLTSIKRASTITFHNDDLWVGYFDAKKQGYIQKFKLQRTADGQLLLGKSVGDLDGSVSKANLQLEAVPQLQGISATDTNVLMTSSFGNRNSKLIRYAIFGDDNLYDGKYVTLPPYLESVAYDKNKNRFYALFESSTPKYRVKTKAVVDRIVFVDGNRLSKYEKTYHELENPKETKVK